MDNKNIELIALSFSKQTMHKIRGQHRKATESQMTFKDNDIFGNRLFSPKNNLASKQKLNDKKYHTYNKENKNHLNQLNLDPKFVDEKKVTFNKIPMKTLEDIEVICEEDTTDTEQPIKPYSGTEPLMMSIDDAIFFNKRLCDKINSFYYPLFEYFADEGFVFDEEKIEIANKQIVNYMNNNLSAFNMGNNKTMEDTFPRLKAYELMTLGLLEFYFQLHLNLYFPFCDEMAVSDVGEIYTCLGEIIYSIYEIVLLIFLNNKGNGCSIKKFLGDKKGKIEDEDSHFESICLNYLEDFYKGRNKPTKEEIPNRLNDLINLISGNLLRISEIITNYYTQIFEVLKNVYDNDFIEEIAFIEKLTSILKDEKIMPQEKKIGFYIQYTQIFSEYIPVLIRIYLKLLDENKVTPPFLPPKQEGDDKITLVLDLDETLVHYIEEADSAFVQVRPGAENFLLTMKEYFELVIFTAASKEYAEIVLRDLDKRKTISAVLYRKHTMQRAGIFLKDLTKLGRDLSRAIIVDNARVNFSLQPENGLEIYPFMGEQSDQELSYLANDLIDLYNMNLRDVRQGLEMVRQRMYARYSQKV